MSEPKMFYFGPWDVAGHFLFTEGGGRPSETDRRLFPWNEWAGQIDGVLQPKGQEVQGVALLHYKRGWTALSFWDRSVDTRHGCNSNYFAEGTFTFDEMVEMSKTRFAERWKKMAFEVTDANPNTPTRQDSRPDDLAGREK